MAATKRRPWLVLGFDEQPQAHLTGLSTWRAERQKAATEEMEPLLDEKQEQLGKEHRQQY